jgi:hypothetical protein
LKKINHSEGVSTISNVKKEIDSFEEPLVNNKSGELYEPENDSPLKTNVSINLLDKSPVADSPLKTNVSIDLLGIKQENKQETPIKLPGNLMASEEDDQGEPSKEPSKSSKKKFNIPEGAIPLFAIGEHCVYVSPTKADGVIYIANAVHSYEENRVPVEDRIDFLKLFENDTISDDELFDALLQIEIKILSLIKANPKIVTSIVYAGQTQGSLQARGAGHKQDFKNPLKANSTKCKTVNLSLESGYDVRFSWLVENLAGKKYFDVVEALINELFYAQVFGGSAVSANNAAYLKLQEFFAWAKRIAELKDCGLYEFREKLGKILFENKVNGANF